MSLIIIDRQTRQTGKMFINPLTAGAAYIQVFIFISTLSPIF